MSVREKLGMAISLQSCEHQGNSDPYRNHQNQASTIPRGAMITVCQNTKQELPSTNSNIHPANGYMRNVALCNVCNTEIPCSVHEDPDRVTLNKSCPVHGPQKTTLSNDIKYWNDAKAIRHKFGKQHKTHQNDKINPLMLILEVIDECDINCPTCIAASAPGMGNARKIDEITLRVQMAAEKLGGIKLLMISGGEPALHPQIIEILHAIKHIPEQIMMITNGIRIATDEKFAEDLGNIGENFGVYLQFDSLNPTALIKLRGADYSNIRKNAVIALNRFNIQTTLIAVIKRGVNENDIADIIKFATLYNNIRGVTFQPIRSSGRHSEFTHAEHSITLTEIRDILLSDFNISSSTLRPHPIHPERICVGYFDKSNFGILPSYGFKVDNDTILPKELLESLYIPRHIESKLFSNNDTLRILIISYLDKYDYTKESCDLGGIYFLMDDGELLILEDRFIKTN